jgi:hypothetical protein
MRFSFRSASPINDREECIHTPTVIKNLHSVCLYLLHLPLLLPLQWRPHAGGDPAVPQGDSAGPDGPL